jgi:hypothetical protein
LAHLNKRTHQLTVRTYTRTSKPRSMTFTYVVERVEDGAVSSPATVTVTLHPVFLIQAKLRSRHRVKFINRNTTPCRIRDHSAQGKPHGLMRFSIPAESSVVRKRPHVRNVWIPTLKKFKIHLAFGYLHAW